MDIAKYYEELDKNASKVKAVHHMLANSATNPHHSCSFTGDLHAIKNAIKALETRIVKIVECERSKASDLELKLVKERLNVAEKKLNEEQRTCSSMSERLTVTNLKINGLVKSLICMM